MDEFPDGGLFLCPSCNQETDKDAKFCKHCAFALETVGEDVNSSSSSPSSSSPTSHRTLLVLGFVAVAILIFILAVVFTPNKQQALEKDSNVNNQPAPPTLGAKGQSIESRILRGESLAASDLEGIPSGELRILRNVHFARYGRRYDQPGLGDYFFKQPWYKVSDSYSDSLLTAVDKENVNLIVSLEKSSGLATAGLKETPSATTSISTPDTTTAPISSSSTLSESEIRDIAKRIGVAGQYDGRVRHNFEILRIGPYNSERKYYPLRVSVVFTDSGKRNLCDAVLFKNDYGDWTLRERACNY